MDHNLNREIADFIKKNGVKKIKHKKILLNI